jgi:pyridoxamine--pyruvate transaminase
MQQTDHHAPRFNLTGGPSGATAATLAALGSPIMNHLDPAFGALYEETAELLRQAFGTAGTPVIIHGEGVVGLEATAASAIGPGDVVLNLVSGVFGKGYGHWARRHAREVIEVEVPYDSRMPPEKVAEAFRLRPDITVVSVVHCETPSGTVNDVDAIAAVTREHGALLIVDTVSSFGGIRCDFAGWGDALAVTAPQKCLGGPPGLSLLHVSDGAWERMAANPAAPRDSVLSILDWRDAHLAGRPFPFTPSVTDVYGLHACLRQYLQEGPEAVLDRHRAAARATRAGVEALGLRLWAGEPAARSDTVTAVRLPGGTDERAVRDHARERSGVLLSGGHGDLSGRLLRIGHMGPSAFSLSAVIAVTAIGRALNALGQPADIGPAVAAAVAALDAEH